MHQRQKKNRVSSHNTKPNRTQHQQKRNIINKPSKHINNHKKHSISSKQQQSLFSPKRTFSIPAGFDPNVAYSNSNVTSDAAQRRWYRNVDIAEEPNGQWAILLNNSYARTNRNNKLIVPTKAYALTCAMELDNQTTFIIDHTMPFVSIAKIAIDRTEEERQNLTENIMNIFDCDSATHRSNPEDYPALSRAQAKVFDPMIQWLEKFLNIEITTTDDFWGCEQSDKTMEKVAATINQLNAYEFIVLDNITALGKSTIVGLNFLYENINIEQAVRGALMEEYYQMKVSGHQIGDTYGTWLLDESARQRVSSHRAALLALKYQVDPSSNWKMSSADLMQTKNFVAQQQQ